MNTIVNYEIGDEASNSVQNQIVLPNSYFLNYLPFEKCVQIIRIINKTMLFENMV